MKATIPADAAKALRLEIKGDQAVVTVTSVLPDGSVEVSDSEAGNGPAAPEATTASYKDLPPMPPGATAMASMM